MSEEKIVIAYKGGKFETLIGKKLAILHPSQSTIAVTQDGSIVFIGNVQDLRYVKIKTNNKEETE
jgi:hypothetical protein